MTDLPRPSADETAMSDARDRRSGWVLRADPNAAHRCAPPPTTRRDDLWRCHCRALWRVGDACDWCDRYDVGPHQGQCMVGVKWRPATAWQRFRYWRQP